LTAAPGRSLALAAAAALAACSIEGRSGEFACGGPEDCRDGRICESGWCVAPGGGGDSGSPPDGAGGDGGVGHDAAPVECSDAVCDACEDGTCVLLCLTADSCPDTVTCPAGMPCRVVCDGVDSCPGGVDCSAATACDIACGKNGACAGPVLCSGGACEVRCNARDTCLGGVDCSAACACNTICSGAGACDLAPECPLDDCVEADGDCTTDGSGCDACGG
jgi:hypothetical protein